MTEIVKVHAVRDTIEIRVTAFEGSQEVSSRTVTPLGGTTRWWLTTHPPVVSPTSAA